MIAYVKAQSFGGQVVMKFSFIYCPLEELGKV